MTMTDPIADYLTRLRNAIQAKHKRVDIPASNLKRELTKLLVDKKFIAGYTEVKDDRQGVLRIQLKYTEGVQPSSPGSSGSAGPGCACTRRPTELPRVLGGLGIGVISTSQGLMTDSEARARKVGGEVLCEIW